MKLSTGKLEELLNTNNYNDELSKYQSITVILENKSNSLVSVKDIIHYKINNCKLIYRTLNNTIINLKDYNHYEDIQNISFYINTEFFSNVKFTSDASNESHNLCSKLGCKEQKGYVCIPDDANLGWPGDNMLNAYQIIEDNHKYLDSMGQKWRNNSYGSGNDGGNVTNCTPPGNNQKTDNHWQCGFGTCYLNDPNQTNTWIYGKDYVLCKDIITQFCKNHPECVGFTLTTMDGGAGSGVRVWMYTNNQSLTNKTPWIYLDKIPSKHNKVCNIYDISNTYMQIAPELCQPWCGIRSNNKKNKTCGDWDECPYNPQPDCRAQSSDYSKKASPDPDYHPCIDERENAWTTDNIDKPPQGYMSNAGSYLVYFPDKFK